MGVQEGIYGYPYLKHILELWPEYWEGKLLNMNEVISEQNRHQK